ncbi:MAG: peptidylprolyl isomerase [Planctomycetota bacterium]
MIAKTTFALLLTLVAAGGLRQDETAGWRALAAAVQKHDYPAAGPLERQPLPDFDRQLAALDAAMAAAKGTSAEPHVRFNRAATLFELGRYEDALAGFRSIKKDFPQHGLCTFRDANAMGDLDLSFVDTGIRDCEAEIEFRKSYEVKSLPHAELDPSVSVVFHTRLGDFEMQFYKNVAPKTVANFLKLVREGFYADTYFHRVKGLREIWGGCPNTRRERGVDRTDDGLGGPGYELDLEPSDAFHVAGAVAMRESGTLGKVNGSQFMICLTDIPDYNNRQHVFGRIVAGLQNARAISQQIADDNDNPYDRVWITGIEIREN